MFADYETKQQAPADGDGLLVRVRYGLKQDFGDLHEALQFSFRLIFLGEALVRTWGELTPDHKWRMRLGEWTPEKTYAEAAHWVQGKINADFNVLEKMLTERITAHSEFGPTMPQLNPPPCADPKG